MWDVVIYNVTKIPIGSEQRILPMINEKTRKMGFKLDISAKSFVSRIHRSYRAIRRQTIEGKVMSERKKILCTGSSTITTIRSINDADS